VLSWPIRYREPNGQLHSSCFLGYGVTCAYMLSAFFLVGFFKDADSHVAPPPYPGTAVSASDETLICRMVWDDESIAATLTALEGGGIRVRLGRLWHGTASIPVTLHKTTSTRWLTDLFLGLGPCLRGCCTSGGELLFGEAGLSVEPPQERIARVGLNGRSLFSKRPLSRQIAGRSSYP